MGQRMSNPVIRFLEWIPRLHRRKSGRPQERWTKALAAAPVAAAADDVFVVFVVLVGF